MNRRPARRAAAAWPLVAFALLATLAVPPAGAQVAESEALLTDATGDGVFVAGPDGAPALPASSGSSLDAAADLVALGLTDSEDDLIFTLQVAELGGDMVNAEYAIAWKWRSQDFVLLVRYWSSAPLGSENAWAELRYVDGDDWYTWAGMSTTVDQAAGTLTTRVSKFYVLDDSQQPPGRGDKLESIRVSSYATYPIVAGDWSARMEDSMGEDAPATYVLQKGDFATGSLRLASNDRVRVSNGGATTFVFKVDVKNTGDALESYALTITDVPEGWDARVQSPLRVPPDETRTVAVLASVPFAHDHGGYNSFNLSVQSERDAGSAGKMRLGVLHTPIPQPAGHHDELYLHAYDYESDPVTEAWQAEFANSWPYLNTVADHEADAPAVGPTQTRDTTYVWSIYLNPGLRVGLDFQIDELGVLDGALLGRATSEGVVRAALTYGSWADGNGEEFVLAQSDEAAVTLARDAEAPFSLTLTPTAESDYVPYTRYQWMRLDFEYETTSGAPISGFRPDPASPHLVTEAFRMQLPLNEYHDRLTGDGVSTALIELYASGAVEKMARPGSVATYAFNVTNHAEQAIAIDVDLAGGDALLGALVPEEPFALAPGETRALTVAVEVPSEAAEGHEIEVLVFAHAVDDPSVSSIARTKTIVTMGSDAVADEREVFLNAQAAQNETPGAPVPLLLFALVAVAVAVQRSRHSA